MNSKMTTNSQLSTSNLKKQKQKQTKQTTRTRTELRNGDHMEGYQQGSGRGREWGKVQRINSINDRWKIDRKKERIV